MKEIIKEIVEKWELPIITTYDGEIHPEQLEEAKESRNELVEKLDKAIGNVLLERIGELQNPYPKDIFKWDNKETLEFARGRFNQHCFEIWENCKNKLIEEVKE